MTSERQQLYASTFKSIGVSLIGGGVVTLPANPPPWLLIAMGCLGVAFQVVGIVFAHLAVAQQTKLVKDNIPTVQLVNPT